MIDVLSPVNTLVSADLNHRYARDEMKRQHHYNKEYMALSFGYGQAEQQNAAMNTKRGLQMAGLSPALASQGMFAPASAPNAPAVSNAPNRASKMDSMFTINDILGLQNLKAQTENIEANTKSTQIKNAQEENANEVSQLLADTYFMKLAGVARDKQEKETYEKLASIAKNKGAFGLMENYLDTLDKKEMYDYHYWDYALKRDISWYQKNASDGSILRDIAELPTKQKKQLDSMIEWYGAQVQNLRSDTKLTDEERNLKLEQIKLTQEQIENLKEVTKNMKNTNIIKMVEDGEYMKAFGATILLLLGNLSASKHF